MLMMLSLYFVKKYDILILEYEVIAAAIGTEIFNDWAL